jgi:Arc/MetJ-type ribon-helix-helix transcriptional regulator
MSSRTVRARLDDASEAALDILVNEGRNESEAVRCALLEAGASRRRREALADEARRLRDDPADREEIRAVMRDMEQLSAGWPPE